MFTIHFDINSSVPLYEQIYRYIKNEIIAGNLICGKKLPSSRSLAVYLEVSRNTVDMAYSQLISEGYIESREKRGYYVNHISNLVHIPKNERKIQTRVVLPEANYRFDFSPFEIDIAHFPYETWKKLSKNCLSGSADIFLQGEGAGDYSFRNAICKYLHEFRGVCCTPEQLVIGAGADYLLQLLLQFLSPDIKVAMENPTYLQAYRIFKGLNREALPISLDKDGIRMDLLQSSGADFVYVTPSHQYPIGIVMPIKRRMDLLDWATEKKGRYILEDDYDSDFRYKGKPIPALQGLDNQGTVIYMGTFSRVIAPAIRVSYMVLPESLLHIYNTRFSYYSSTVSRIDQNIITLFLEHGYFERHVNRMRKLYKSRHDTLIRALKIFGSAIKILGENAGLHLIICLNCNCTEEELIYLADKHGIRLYGLKEHFIVPVKQEQDMPSFLMGYGNLSEEQINKGVQELYHILIKNELLNL